MGYKPKHTSSGSYGDWMLALVEYNGDKTKVRISPKDEEKPFVVLAKNVPEGMPSGKLKVRVNAEEKKITAYQPYQGLFEAELERFAAPENEKPAPKTKQVSFVKDGKDISYSYQYFTMLFKIVGGDFDGVLVPYVLRHNFAEGEEEIQGAMRKVVWLKGKGKHTEALEECWDALGMWEQGPMKYTDNPLPKFEKRGLQANKRVRLFIKEGWIQTVFALDDISGEFSD